MTEEKSLFGFPVVEVEGMPEGAAVFGDLSLFVDSARADDEGRTVLCVLEAGTWRGITLGELKNYDGRLFSEVIQEIRDSLR